MKYHKFRVYISQTDNVGKKEIEIKSKEELFFQIASHIFLDKIPDHGILDICVPRIKEERV